APLVIVYRLLELPFFLALLGFVVHLMECFQGFFKSCEIKLNPLRRAVPIATPAQETGKGPENKPTLATRAANRVALSRKINDGIWGALVVSRFRGRRA